MVMRSPLTTLCYIEKDRSYLMMHRVSKDHDINKDKWIGVGGHFEDGESPDDCLIREVREETGLTLTSYRFCGLVTFISDRWPTEYMCLYHADGFTGSLKEDCEEGVLTWVPVSEIDSLKLWEGDRIFLRLMRESKSFFSLKLVYQGDLLTRAVLNGINIDL
ncbi:MAG: 8-oxo-dGTP diphosphatase [Eubacterium sp.]|nr:8-oxo-dGTP diphosphatase [Eubacterium sp.]